MDKTALYRDMMERTNGDIYFGIVGPVRTGKSTFIKRFAELFMIPNLSDDEAKKRLIDELPQSGNGKSIMTTQPKFVPNEAVEITFDETAKARIRMIDCVGFMVPGAIGSEEDGETRMVTTPWFDHDIPFEQAAEYGTKNWTNRYYRHVKHGIHDGSGCADDAFENCFERTSYAGTKFAEHARHRSRKPVYRGRRNGNQNGGVCICDKACFEAYERCTAAAHAVHIRILFECTRDDRHGNR